jgi:CheY-like chemotaxis protein
MADVTPGLGRCMEGRDVRRVDSGAAAVAAWRSSGCDALVIGPALEDMSALDLVRAIGAAAPDSDDLPLAMIEGPAAPLAVTLETGTLRHRARLEDVLGETALYLARSVGSAPAARREAPARRAVAAPELNGRTALIVDDDIYNVYAVTGALEQHGMTAVLAENVREGIAALHAHPEIEIVLIDITMPEVDGDSAIHALRATHERPLPIIAMTLRAMPGDRAKCIGAGASDYVSKPINVGQLLGLLRTWLAPVR